MAPRNRRGLPRVTSPWGRYVVASLALLGAFVIAVAGGAPGVVRASLFQVALAAGIAGMLIGIRLHRPTVSWPWLLLASMILNFAGILLPSVLGPASAQSMAHAADIVFLLGYALTALALVLIVRRRTPGWDLPGLLDAGAITVSAALLSWIYLIYPVISRTDAGLATRLFASAYPFCDLMLAALSARLLLGTGLKTVAARSIAGFLALLIIPDSIDAAAKLTEGSFGQSLTYLLWMTAALLSGLAGIHPSMRDLVAPSAAAAPDIGPLRLAALAVASLLAPATLLIQYLRGAPLHVPLVSASCGVLFLLVIGRLASMVAVQRRMAATDGLTGLRTRRFFQDALQRLPGTRSGAAMVLLDIDNFKLVNDTYGHDGGDRVLREVARRLTGAVRANDVLARYGGEEFAVLLLHTAPDEARKVADRLHAAVRERRIPLGPEVAITVTVSVGVANLPPDAEPDRLPLLADQLLYSAKNAGRDRVLASASALPVASAA
jgi:two-component system, cell cycle response regulator